MKRWFKFSFTVAGLLAGCMPLQPLPPTSSPSPSVTVSVKPSPTALPSSNPVEASPLPSASSSGSIPSPSPEPTPRPTGYPVEIVAGSGQQGFQDGPALQASFNQPAGLCTGLTGDIYIMDTHQIRKLTPAGIVSTLTGSQESGYRDGNLEEARFNRLITCSFDRHGNLLVLDHRNNRIRKISPEGLVSTVLGTGENNLRDGTLQEAALSSSLNDIEPLADGSLYLADGHYLRLFKKGVLKTLNPKQAGPASQHDYRDGKIEEARLSGIIKLASDPQGNLYLADSGARRLRRMSQDQIVSTLSRESYEVPVSNEDVWKYWIPLPIAIVFDGIRKKLFLTDIAAVYEAGLSGEAKILASTGLASNEGKENPFERLGEDITVGQDHHLYMIDSTTRTIKRLILPKP